MEEEAAVVDQMMNFRGSADCSVVDLMNFRGLADCSVVGQVCRQRNNPKRLILTAVAAEAAEIDAAG